MIVNETYETLISTDALERILDDPTLVVFDCRFAMNNPDAGRAQYLASHVPGASYVDLDKDMSSAPTPDSGRHPLPSIDRFAENLRRWGVDNDSQVAVYDDVGGAIAGRMWWLLRYLGHNKVALLDGGFDKWLNEGRAVASGNQPSPNKGNFSPEVRAEMKIDTSELEHIYRDEDVIVIDARGSDRYSGEKETMDTEGGHIPGAVNHPFQNNLDERNCFRPAEELKNTYAPMSKARPIHSCGSGVTACHNLLAMEVAGLPAGRLYVGSWSEWIRSPKRPRTIGSDG